jgi:hypothetical protein
VGRTLLSVAFDAGSDLVLDFELRDHGQHNRGRAALKRRVKADASVEHRFQRPENTHSPSTTLVIPSRAKGTVTPAHKRRSQKAPFPFNNLPPPNPPINR